MQNIILNYRNDNNGSNYDPELPIVQTNHTDKQPYVHL